MGHIVMADYQDSNQQHLKSMLEGKNMDEVAARLQPDRSNPPRISNGSPVVSANHAEHHWKELGLSDEHRTQLQEALLTPFTEELSAYQGHVENVIGLLRTPIGVAGPLRVRGMSAQGDFPIPLATTEAALVASYHRGCRVLTLAGGCRSIVLSDGVSRSPGFVFPTVLDACQFVIWAGTQHEKFREITTDVIGVDSLTEVSPIVEGNSVYLDLRFASGDSASLVGVNRAVDGICDWIARQSPVPPDRHYPESNFSGEKRAGFSGLTGGRGKRVVAEAILPAEVVRKYLHTGTQAMADYWRLSSIGATLGGSTGGQGHFANGLTAFYLATGQDVASAAASATGVTRMEVTPEGDLYASLSLPSVLVGSVGGATELPSQKACLELMGLSGADKGYALAEVCAGLLLAGELSIVAAMTADRLNRTHRPVTREREE